jgi:hypothetical protein
MGKSTHKLHPKIGKQWLEAEECWWWWWLVAAMAELVVVHA